MGRIQPPEAVAKNKSTSIYGNAVSLAESPRVQGLLYVGTDDGLVHVTGDGGKSWRKIESFPGIPTNTYVSCLTASQHDDNTVFAAFDNHKNADFTPYLLASTNRGETWTAIAGDLPKREVVLSVQQDHQTPSLLFAGTEFGAWFTLDGGVKWTRFTSLPTIAVRDIEIQRRESDLILGTFGRGIYILDDYSPLRVAAADFSTNKSSLLPVKDALLYAERSRLGGRNGAGSQGATYFTAPNPPFGAVFTFYLHEKIRTLKETRQEAEKKALKEKRDIRYPTLAELRAEDEETEPSLALLIRDDEGLEVTRVPAPREKGLHRRVLNLRLPSAQPVEVRARQSEADDDSDRRSSSGPFAPPGAYTVQLIREQDGKVVGLAPAVPFNVIPLELSTFPPQDREAVLAFNAKVARLQRAVEGTVRAAAEVESRLAHLRRAAPRTAGGTELVGDVRALEDRLRALQIRLTGDKTLAKHEEPLPPTIQGRVQMITGTQWRVTTAPTQTHRDAYRFAGGEFGKVLAEFRTLAEKDLPALEARFEKAGAPWTPGRVPKWKME
jgi:hypothetical protein